MIKDILPEDKVEAEVEFFKIKAILGHNSSMLRRVYKAYSAMGNVKDHIAVSSVEWKLFVEDLKIINSSFTLAKADIIFVKADVVEGTGDKIEKTGDLS